MMSEMMDPRVEPDASPRSQQDATIVEDQEDDHVRSEKDAGMNLLTEDNRLELDSSPVEGSNASSSGNAEHETDHLVPNGVGRPSSLLRVAGSHLSVANSTTKSISFCDLNLKPETNPYPVHPSPGRQKMSRREQAVLMKDLFLVSVAFMLLYSAFNGIQNMASSLFQDKGLGVTSYSFYYASGITSTFLTPVILKKLTPKWTLVLCHFLTCLFLGSLLYPRVYTVIPSSLLIGITNGPLWAAAAVYVTTAGFEYASRTGKTVGPVMSHCHGIWMTFVQLSQIIGNLISSLVFQVGEMAKPESYYGRVCGAEQCPVLPSERDFNLSRGLYIVVTSTNSTDSYDDTGAVINGNDELNSTIYHHPAHDSGFINKIYILGGVYISLVVVATILLVAFLGVFRASSAIKDFGSNISMASVLSDQQSTKNLLMSSFKLWTKPNMLLLMPMAYLTGVHQGYLYADFTQAYISCTIGVSWVGYTMICYGATNVIFCYLGGKLNRLVGRIPLYTGAFIIHSSLIITLILWTPSPDSLAPFFIIPALWGVCDAVWQPQTTALLSTLFPRHQEAGFANYRMLHCLGFAVTFGLSQTICTGIKFYIFEAVLICAFVSYIILELRLRKTKCLFTQEKKSSNSIIITGNALNS